MENCDNGKKRETLDMRKNTPYKRLASSVKHVRLPRSLGKREPFRRCGRTGKKRPPGGKGVVVARASMIPKGIGTGRSRKTNWLTKKV